MTLQRTPRSALLIVMAPLHAAVYGTGQCGIGQCAMHTLDALTKWWRCTCLGIYQQLYIQRFPSTRVLSGHVNAVRVFHSEIFYLEVKTATCSPSTLAALLFSSTDWTDELTVCLQDTVVRSGLGNTAACSRWHGQGERLRLHAVNKLKKEIKRQVARKGYKPTKVWLP